MLSWSPKPPRKERTDQGPSSPGTVTEEQGWKLELEHHHLDSTQLARWQGTNTWISSSFYPQGGTIIGFKNRFEINPALSLKGWGHSYVSSEAAFSLGKEKGQTKCHTQYMTVLLLSTSMSTFDFTWKIGLKPWGLHSDLLLDIGDFIHLLIMFEMSAMCQILSV